MFEYLSNCSSMSGILPSISGFVNVYGCSQLDSPTLQPYHLIIC